MMSNSEHPPKDSCEQVVQAAQILSSALSPLKFGPPVTHVYNPLEYAWAPHEMYLRKFAQGRKRILFLGMNPGPFGMVQTGVPFGDILMVRTFLGIEAPVNAPALQNPKRAIEGFACKNSEVSGTRLWTLMREHYASAEAFAEQAFVLNYCPLAFFNLARNLTPDKLASAEMAPVYAACDAHLRKVAAALEPEWFIGVGAFAQERLALALEGLVDKSRIGRILHPSPASPAANRGWGEAATGQLEQLGVW